MSGADADYQFLPSGPLREWLDWVMVEYQSWDILANLAGLHPRVLYRVRESDYVSVRVADILFTRIGGGSFYEYYSDEDVVPRGEVTRSRNQQIDNSADAQRRRARRQAAKAFGEKHGLGTRYVLEEFGEFWSDGKLDKIYDDLEKRGSMYHKRRVLEISRQLGVDAALVNADDYAAWRNKDHWVLAARFQRSTAPRVWGRCLAKLGTTAEVQHTEEEYQSVFFSMGELAHQVVVAAQVFNYWRWAFYVLRALELCGWKPEVRAPGHLARRAPGCYATGQAPGRGRRQ